MICVHPSEFEWQGAHKVGLLWQRSFYMISSVVRDGRHFMVHLKIKGAPHCHYQPHKVRFPLLQLAKSVSGWVASERWERQLKTEVMSNTRNDQMMRLIDAFVLNHFVKWSHTGSPWRVNARHLKRERICITFQLLSTTQNNLYVAGLECKWLVALSSGMGNES